MLTAMQSLTTSKSLTEFVLTLRRRLPRNVPSAQTLRQAKHDYEQALGVLHTLPHVSSTTIDTLIHDISTYFDLAYQISRMRLRGLDYLFAAKTAGLRFDHGIFQKYIGNWKKSGSLLTMLAELEMRSILEENIASKIILDTELAKDQPDTDVIQVLILLATIPFEYVENPALRKLAAIADTYLAYYAGEFFQPCPEYTFLTRNPLFQYKELLHEILPVYIPAKLGISPVSAALLCEYTRYATRDIQHVAYLKKLSEIMQQKTTRKYVSAYKSIAIPAEYTYKSVTKDEMISVHMHAFPYVPDEEIVHTNAILHLPYVDKHILSSLLELAKQQHTFFFSGPVEKISILTASEEGIKIGIHLTKLPLSPFLLEIDPRGNIYGIPTAGMYNKEYLTKVQYIFYLLLTSQ